MTALQAFRAALRGPSDAVPAQVVVRPGADAAQRFAVYRNNIAVALLDALAQTYPVVAQLVGDDFFRGMARAFVAEHRPRSPVMAEFGAGFADFVDTFAPAASVPYLPDMARLEWQRVRSFHAEDAAPAGLDAIAARLGDPDRLPSLRFGLDPALAVIESPYAIVSLWAAHQQATPGAVHAALAGVDPFVGETALVLRDGDQVLVMPVAPGPRTFIGALQAGAPLGAAASDATAADPNFDLAGSLALLISHHAIVRLDH